MKIWDDPENGPPEGKKRHQKEKIFDNTKNAAYQIISSKGSTYYAIALAIDRICAAILQNEGAVLNVSTLLNNYHGISGVYLGAPCIIDRTGVRSLLPITITTEEEKLLQESANKLKEIISSINI